MAIEVSRKENIKSVMENMKKMNLNFKVVNESKEFYEMIV
jgi:threonine dehydratase